MPLHSNEREYHWCIPEEAATIVRVQQVVAPDLLLVAISETNKLPRNCNKQEALRLGAKRIPDDLHDDILDKIVRREEIDYLEELQSDDEENDNDSNSSSSERSNNDNTNNDNSDNENSDDSNIIDED